MLVGINAFARRQTAESRFSHFTGNDERLLALVEAGFPGARPGFRDGVLLVSVPPAGFFSGVVEIDERTPLVATLTRRRPAEAPYVEVSAREGAKLPALAVEIVLFRKDVLLADGDPVSGADWDVISVNARPTAEPEPMTPVAMARNFLGLPGGTLTAYPAEEFARAILYWSTRAMIAAPPPTG